MFFCENDPIDIRSNIYGKSGFSVIENFIPKDKVESIRNNWNQDISFYFSDFIKNSDVTTGVPKYLYNRPTKDDYAYCTHVWNKPVDELLHEYSFKIQMMRNILEGNPLYYGLHESTGKALQYRVCRTLSNSIVVKKHADFFEEYRRDPTGSHSFDPSRIGATLFLSDYGTDYQDGGFKLWSDTNDSYVLFGRDVNVSSGDLVFWRYSLSHEVSGVTPIHHNNGFLRVIYPLFDVSYKET